MGIFTLFDRAMGDSRLAPDAQRLSREGREQFHRGIAIEDEGLEGFRGLNAEYGGRLRSGNVLDPSLTRAFQQRRGGVREQALRNLTGLRGRIAQRAAENGGMIPAAALLELEQGGNEEIQAQEFSAMGEVDAAEAEARMASVLDLMDRIERGTGQITQAGARRSALGGQLNVAGQELRLGRQRAIANTITSIFGGMGGSGGGGFS